MSLRVKQKMKTIPENAIRSPMPTNKNFINRVGSVFGKLTVIEYYGKINDKHSWICHCSCDENEETRKEVIFYTNYLTSGDTNSCGCLIKKKPWKVKHNLCETPEYKIWKRMIARCYNKKNKKYKNYGGRGIQVCERWKHSPELFLSDMGPRPVEEGVRYSIDRINVNGNYEPENCRWATDKEQADNKTISVYLNYNGKHQTMNQWAKETGLTRTIIRSRLDRGWSIEKTLTTPKLVNQYG